MTRKKRQPDKKRRTRQHVIADLSVNHAERPVLLCGFSVERIEHDYGIDLLLFTYNTSGEIENGEIRLQVKATDQLKINVQQREVSFRIDRADLWSWLWEPMPVILIVYDAATEVAYWLYVQEHFEARRKIDLGRVGKTVTVGIPSTQVLSPASVRHFAHCRDRVLAQMKGVIRHHEG